MTYTPTTNLNPFYHHKTISILGATLQHAMWDLFGFAMVMLIIFAAFTTVIYLQYHDLTQYSTMPTAMGSQVLHAVTRTSKAGIPRRRHRHRHGHPRQDPRRHVRHARFHEVIPVAS